MSIDITIVGAEKLREKIASLGKNGLHEGAAALYQEALGIKERAFNRCPKDTGALRDSHVVTRPDIKGDDVSVTIAAGGPAAPYAIYVHENLSAHHPIGEAKWLERTVLEAADGLASKIASRMDLNRMAR